MRTHHRRLIREHIPKTRRLYGDLQKPKRDWSGFRRRVFSIVIAGSVLAGIYALTLGPTFRIKEVTVQGALLSDPQKIAAAVKKNDSVWTVDQEQIQQSVQQSQPVERLVVRRILPSTVQIEVFEAPLAMIWQTQGAGVTVTESGIAVALVSDYRSGDPQVQTALKQLPTVTDQRNIPVKTGEQVVGISFIDFIRQSMQAYATYIPDLPVQSVSIQDTTYEVQVILQGGLRVVMSTIDKPEVQVRNVARLRRDGKLRPDGVVDVRVDRWAFVQ
jgi:hypothetical protein